MKQLILNRITAVMDNPHTSWSAVIGFSAAAIGVLWPQYADKCEKIVKLAIFYGLVAAGDAKTQPPATPKP